MKTRNFKVTSGKRSFLKIASISDVHVFHTLQHTKHILEQLTLTFPDNTETGSLDMIIIAGDFFDRIATVSSESSFLVMRWIVRFLRVCYKHDIVLRVLEGTPSHDRGQPMLFKVLADSSKHDIDVKYIDVLSIEHIDRFDIDVLYLPDEWRPDPEDTWLEVKDLMISKGLSHVDYSVMHGCFEHQLPKGINFSHHKAKRYSKITRKYVLCGHIHQMSKRDNILVAGSFDRNCHGDEGDKGHWRIEERQEGDVLTFVKNTNAVIYKTIHVDNLNIGEIYDKLNDLDLGNFPMQSNVRLSMTKGSDGAFIIDELNDTYNNIKFTSKITDPEEAELIERLTASDEELEELAVPEIIPRNIEELTRGMLSELGMPVPKALSEDFTVCLDTIKED